MLIASLFPIQGSFFVALTLANSSTVAFIVIVGVGVNSLVYSAAGTAPVDECEILASMAARALASLEREASAVFTGGAGGG
jgi:hypothetical protein